MFIEWISHRRKCMIYPLEHGWEELNETLFSGGCRHNNYLPSHMPWPQWGEPLLKQSSTQKDFSSIAPSFFWGCKGPAILLDSLKLQIVQLKKWISPVGTFSFPRDTIDLLAHLTSSGALSTSFAHLHAALGLQGWQKSGEVIILFASVGNGRTHVLLGISLIQCGNQRQRQGQKQRSRWSLETAHSFRKSSEGLLQIEAGQKCPDVDGGAEKELWGENEEWTMRPLTMSSLIFKTMQQGLHCLVWEKSLMSLQFSKGQGS